MIEPTPPAAPMISSVPGRVPGQAKPVKQRLPGGDRGQRQRRRLGEAQRAGTVADDPLVDGLQLGVGALDGSTITGVPDLVAGLERRDLGTDRLDHPGRVEAEHPGGSPGPAPRGP